MISIKKFSLLALSALSMISATSFAAQDKKCGDWTCNTPTYTNCAYPECCCKAAKTATTTTQQVIGKILNAPVSTTVTTTCTDVVAPHP